MGEKYLQFAIPEEVFMAIDERSVFQGDTQNRLRTNLAIGMFVMGEISLARAAALAELSIFEFRDVLTKLRIPVLTYTEEMFADDLQFAGIYKEALTE